MTKSTTWGSLRKSRSRKSRYTCTTWPRKKVRALHLIIWIAPKPSTRVPTLLESYLLVGSLENKEWLKSVSLAHLFTAILYSVPNSLKIERPPSARKFRWRLSDKCNTYHLYGNFGEKFPSNDTSIFFWHRKQERDWVVPFTEFR